jgi:histidinol-phosphate aminotransferase
MKHHSAEMLTGGAFAQVGHAAECVRIVGPPDCACDGHDLGPARKGAARMRFEPHQRIAAIAHGGPPAIPEPEGRVEAGLRRLNLNESALPPSRRALSAMAAALAEVGTYPDHSCRAVTGRLAATAGIGAERIVCGNGSGELLIAAALAAVGPGDEAAIPSPTFPAIAKGVVLAGGTVVSVPTRPDGIVDDAALLAAVTPQTRLVYTCTPNNPTGGAMEREALRRLALETPDRCLLVVDEAYYEFGRQGGAPDALAVMAERKGAWVVTRTFSKAYALAGLRIGYAFASDPGVASALDKLRGSFTVNRVGLAGAAAAYDDEPHMRGLVEATALERERLARGLAALGCAVLPSCTNFVLARTPSRAADLAAALADAGILVQAVPWPDATGSLRVSVGRPADTDALLAALGPLLQERAGAG